MALPVAPPDCTAVVFISQFSGNDGPGYAEAAQAMELAAAKQPGYRGFVSARGADGVGIAVSYWADDAAALAWRKHSDHARTIARGRAVWYDAYAVSVATVTRSYDWQRGGA